MSEVPLQDRQGQILVLAFRFKSFKPFKLFPLRSEAEHVLCEGASSLPGGRNPPRSQGLEHEHFTGYSNHRFMKRPSEDGKT